MVSSCLRGHIIKHLSCTTFTTTITATFFSFVRHIHRPKLNPLAPLLGARSRFLSSLFTGTPNKWLLNSSTGTKFFTAALPDASARSSFLSPYFLVEIQCRKDVADILSEALLCFGASSTSMDEQDYCEDEDMVFLTSIFSDCQEVDECISRAAKSIGLEETPSYKVTEGDQSDWIKLSQESFYPVEITKGLWTVPEWRNPPDLHATNIILNPGLAFGTGEHPTTKLCLLLLHGLIRGGEFVLDYGTGSGILAIAAVKFGAALSVGLDIDPQAISSARHNASLNNIGSEKLQLHLVNSKKISPIADEAGCERAEEKTLCGTRDISETGKYDVVIANILLNPLLDLADHIVSYAKPGAVVSVSGIISEQIPRIEERYSQFLEGISVSKMDDWACIRGKKKR